METAAPEESPDLSVLGLSPDEGSPIMSVARAALEDRVGMDHPGWHDYVLGHFQEDELFNGLPTVKGLRRVARKLLGALLQSSSRIVQAPTFSADALPVGGWQPVVAEHTLVFLWKIDDEALGREVAFADVAEVWADNCPDKNIFRFMASTAATRAEARAYKRALQLKCLTSEELVEPVPARVEPEYILDEQIVYLEARCRQADIDLQAFVNSGKSTYKTIRQVPHERAKMMVEKLSDYLNKPDTIPSSIKGFKRNWRETFLR